jgi:hypothetical protein
VFCWLSPYNFSLRHEIEDAEVDDIIEADEEHGIFIAGDVSW